MTSAGVIHTEAKPAYYCVCVLIYHKLIQTAALILTQHELIITDFSCQLNLLFSTSNKPTNSWTQRPQSQWAAEGRGEFPVISWSVAGCQSQWLPADVCCSFELSPLGQSTSSGCCLWERKQRFPQNGHILQKLLTASIEWCTYSDAI